MTYLEKTVKLYAAREALAVSLNLTVTDAEVDQRGPFRDGYQGQTTKSFRVEARQTILTEKLLAYFEAWGIGGALLQPADSAVPESI